MTDVARYARHYTNIGLALVPIPLGLKGPREAGWNEPHNTITTREEAHRKFSGAPLNMGVLHSASHTATLDIDHPEWAAQALAAVGLDLGELLACPTRIRGKNGEKPFYRLPDGVQFDRRSLAWPHPTEVMSNGRPKLVTVLELRAGAVQDVLPPSIHPDTGRPYEWAGTPPRARTDIPLLPPALQAIWENWEEAARQMRQACPWAAPEQPQKPRQATPRPSTPTDPAQRPGDVFRARVNIREVLERNGYQRKGERYLPPDSKTKVAGVRILTGDDGMERAFSDHGSCPLNDEHAHDSFSAFVLLEHAGNLTAAVKAAAQELGLERPTPPPVPRPEPLTAAQVQQQWEAQAMTIQQHGGMVLDNMTGHPHVKNALINIWMTLTHIAPSILHDWQGQWVLNFGGLTKLKAYGVTGTNADITARLRQLADLGFFLKVIKTDPADRTSPILLAVPADPRDLPMMRLTQEESKSQAVKSRDRPSSKVRLTLSNIRKARPNGIDKGKAYFALSAARLTVLYLACQTTATVAELAEIRCKQPETIRRQIRMLEQAGIVSRKGHTLTLQMDWPAFLEMLRFEREHEVVIRRKVLRALERSEMNARRRVYGLGAKRLPIRELKKRRATLSILHERVERVRAGEPLWEVLGLAA